MEKNIISCVLPWLTARKQMVSYVVM